MLLAKYQEADLCGLEKNVTEIILWQICLSKIL